MIGNDALPASQASGEITYTRTITDADVALFALITGDQHPLHLDADYATASPFARRIVPTGLISGVIEAALAAELAARNGVVQQSTLTFLHPAFIDEELRVTLAPQEATACHWRGAVTVTRQDGALVARGEVAVALELGPDGFVAP